MPISNVVRISELPAFIAETMEAVRLGVASARAAGLNCELPHDVDFQVVVIRDWQALEILSNEDGTTVESKSGSSDDSTTRDTSEGSSETKATDEVNSKQNDNAHKERNSEFNNDVYP